MRRPNLADLIAFGYPFFANPERLRTAAPLNELDRATLYGASIKGYTDYPSLQPHEAS